MIAVISSAYNVRLISGRDNVAPGDSADGFGKQAPYLCLIGESSMESADSIAH